MIKLFGILSYFLSVIIVGTLLSIGIVEDVWDEPSYLITLASISLLALLQMYFTNKSLNLLHHQAFHEVIVIDDLLSFESNTIIQNKNFIKVIGLVCTIAFMVLLGLMTFLFIQIADDLIRDLRYNEGNSVRDYTSQAFFYSIIFCIPLSITTIWYNLYMFRTKRIKESTDESIR